MRSAGTARADRAKPPVRRRRHGTASHRRSDEHGHRGHLRSDAVRAVGPLERPPHGIGRGRSDGSAVPAVRSARMRPRRLQVFDATRAGRRDRRGGERDGLGAAAALMTTNATGTASRWMTDQAIPALPAAPLERAALLVMLGFAAALQISIAAADILLTIVVLLWIALLVRNRERIEVPAMFWPLAVYGIATLVAAVFAVDPPVSLIRCKQLVLYVIVPLTYRLLRGRRGALPPDVLITVGALSATHRSEEHT